MYREFMVRKFTEEVLEGQLQKDLEKYRKRAIELGASDAKVITTDMVILDERVRAKCMYPKCRRYGTNINCPPYTPDVNQTRKIVENYKYGIFFKLDVPSEDIAGPLAKESRAYGPYSAKRAEIVAKLEAEAFHDGYHLALGFGGGSCKGHYCPDVECDALKPGQACRAPLKARAAMEAVSMDVYTMATKVGWDIYPIGERTPPSEVPCGLFLGMVLVY
jgi:predicted metal-binding protein